MEIMLSDIVPSGLLRCSPEHVFTVSAFATAVLIKVSAFAHLSLLSRG